jgi:hypothetical protein
MNRGMDVEWMDRLRDGWMDVGLVGMGWRE